MVTVRCASKTVDYHWDITASVNSDISAVLQMNEKLDPRIQYLRATDVLDAKLFVISSNVTTVFDAQFTNTYFCICHIVK